MRTSLSKVKTRNRKTTLKKILKNKKKRIRFYLLFGGIALLGLGFLTSNISSNEGNEIISNQVSQNEILEVNSFKDEPVKVDKNLLNPVKNKKKIPPNKILIPKIGIDITVKPARVINGYWEVFKDTAGFGLGSAYPDEVGNQVIFAHARDGLFINLKEVSLGDLIYIFTDNSWYTYKVIEIKEVYPDKTDVINPTKSSILTLYTCSGFQDSKRLIVTAEKT
jgi:LPXTG-site transpeptidase (sortase) family protein